MQTITLTHGHTYESTHTQCMHIAISQNKNVMQKCNLTAELLILQVCQNYLQASS
jgi:hypothetical protein